MPKRYSWIVLSLVLFGVAQATDYKPWTPVDFLLYPKLDILFQHYDKINSSQKDYRVRANDQFYTLGVSGCYTPWCVELELTGADTKFRNFSFDNLKITGRYQLASDIVGDFLSMMVGVSYIKASKGALLDPSSFHHGRNEVELHFSVGREQACFDTWSSRWWSVGFFGVADHGSPWWRLIAAWEKNVNRSLFFRVFGHGLIGMGGDPFKLGKSFSGYGPVKHRSLDLGVRLTKQTECYGIWYLEYAKRVYSHNFPQGADLIIVSITYPYHAF